MTNLEFKYWLKGFYELSEDHFLDQTQIRIIKNHADLAKRTEGKLNKDIRRFLTQLKAKQDSAKLIQVIIHEINLI